jgi:peptide/nickel transport system substrate-binding protein
MLKTIRRIYWLIQKFASRHYKIVLRSLAIVLTIAAALLIFAKYLPASRKVTRIGIVGKFTEESLPTAIQIKVSSGLISLSITGDPSPALAKSWDISEDGKVYKFILDDSVVWHDGAHLIPSDINFSFKEVETAYGDNTVTYTLKEPFAPFLSVVSKPILKNNKVGTGTFRILKSKVYAGVLQETTIISDTEKLVYKFYPTESSAVTAFKLGEIDQLDNISSATEELKNDNTVILEPKNELARIVVLFFNNNDTVLNSKTTRQGLAYAIKDKSFGRTRALSPIDKSSWGYNPLVKEYEYDKERAETLFYTDLQKDNRPVLELKTTLAYLDVAEKIAENWRETLGIQVNVKVVTNITSDYQALLTDYAPPIDPDQYTIWHSTQPTNFTHYSNLRVDKLLEDGRRTMDPKLRRDIYQDFQRFLLEDSPAVFLFRTTGFTLSRKPIFN